MYNLLRMEVGWRQIACLVCTLVSAYLKKVKKPSHPPLDDGWMTDEPPLDGGWMAVKNTVGVVGVRK